MKMYHDLPKISSNAFYSGKHWSSRKDIVNDYHQQVYYLCKKQYAIQPIEKYPIRIEFGFNNRFDVDNNSGMVKMIIDGLKCCGIITDDTKRHVSEIVIKASDENYFEILVDNL